jgi:hypothetical protein
MSGSKCCNSILTHTKLIPITNKQHFYINSQGKKKKKAWENNRIGKSKIL